MRNLATIQKVTNIRPIPEADSIEVCDVLGWHVVIKKGEFQEGDLSARRLISGCGSFAAASCASLSKVGRSIAVLFQ